MQINYIKKTGLRKEQDRITAEGVWFPILAFIHFGSGDVSAKSFVNGTRITEPLALQMGATVFETRHDVCVEEVNALIPWRELVKGGAVFRLYFSSFPGGKWEVEGNAQSLAQMIQPPPENPQALFA